MKHAEAMTGGFGSIAEDLKTEKTKYDMAVTVTLVFSDESHREAWLEMQGIVPDVEVPPKNKDGEIELPEDRDLRRKITKRIDYNRRQHGPDLSYLVGPLGGSNPRRIP